MTTDEIWLIAGQPPSEDFAKSLMRAAAMAYRAASGRGDDQTTCVRLADEARIAAGGRADDLRRITIMMIAQVAGHYPEWFWGPTNRRLEWEEQCLRRLGCWPPPLSRAKWPPIPPMPASLADVANSPLMGDDAI